MLYYLTEAVTQLSFMMLMIAFIMGYIHCAYSTVKTGRIMKICLAVGFVLAVVMTCYKTYTSKVDTAVWNLIIYAVTAALLVLAAIFGIIGRKKKQFGEWTVSLTLGAEIVLLMVYFLPFFMELPHNMTLSVAATADSTWEIIFSSDFMVKLAGWLIGLILTLVATFAAYKLSIALGRGHALAFMLIILILNVVKMLGASFSIMMAKRMIANNHVLFVFAKLMSNYSNWFSFAGLLMLAIAALIVLIRSTHVSEPYSNPAEHRIIRSKWRMRRRWVVTGCICIVLCILCSTLLYNIAHKGVELTEVVDATIEGDNVIVTFDEVNDGELHRFKIYSDSGTEIRFIVIQKPGSNTYGVGLDACDVCGKTGYYQDGEYIICSLCSQPINIRTIGFPGGCNPIVFDYTVEDDRIIIPVQNLLDLESEFK